MWVHMWWGSWDCWCLCYSRNFCLLLWQVCCPIGYVWRYSLLQQWIYCVCNLSKAFNDLASYASRAYRILTKLRNSETVIVRFFQNSMRLGFSAIFYVFHYVSVNYQFESTSYTTRHNISLSIASRFCDILEYHTNGRPTPRSVCFQFYPLCPHPLHFGMCLEYSSFHFRS